MARHDRWRGVGGTRARRRGEITRRGGIAFADTSDVSTEQGAEEMVRLAVEHFAASTPWSITPVS